MILAKREKDNSWAGTPMARLAMLTQGEQWGSVVDDGDDNGGVDDKDGAGGHDVNHMFDGDVEGDVRKTSTCPAMLTQQRFAGSSFS